MKNTNFISSGNGINFSKKNIIIIILAALLLIGGGVTAFMLVKSSTGASAVETALRLAEKYLLEQDYEQAIIEFSKVLEIEPMNVDAYLGLAEAYIGLGDTKTAVAVLRSGLEVTGDSRLSDKIGEIRTPVFGSMGSVTILGEEYDIATTDTLFLSERGITNDILKQIVPQIAQLTNLMCLDLYRNEISDISPLADLKDLANLHNIRLMYNQISDISSFVQLKNLEDLMLIGNQIADISALSELKNLKRIYLNGNEQIADISPLSALNNLENIDIENLPLINDFSALCNLSNLRSLYIGGDDFTDDYLKQAIPQINEIQGLYYLSVRCDIITDLSPFAELTNIKALDIANSMAADISPISNITNLESLGLVSNHSIEDYSSLTKLTNLKRLYLNDSDSNVDITPIFQITSLESMDIRADFDPVQLENLPNLVDLKCWFYEDSDVRSFANLSGLKTLDFMGTASYYFSDEEMAWLTEQLPECEISF